MANIKITDLTAYTDAASTDVLPIVDVTADVTKKIAIGDVVKAVPAGTTALPGLAFDGDPDTGLSSPDLNELALSTGGTGRLFIDSDGGVGIGESAPSNYGSGVDDLVIKSAGSTGISIISTGVLEGGSIAFGDATLPGRGKITYSNLNTLGFQTNSTERLEITSTGTVNIVGGASVLGPAVVFNGSAPASSLIVNSSGNVSTAGTMTADSFIPTSNTVPANGVYLPAANTVAVATNGTGRLFVDASGNVGISASGPSAPLVFGKSTYSSFDDEPFYRIKFQDVGGVANDVGIGQQASGSLGFNIASGGNYAFYGGAGASERLRIASTGTTTITSAAATVPLVIKIDTSEVARIDSSGRLGIGTSGPSNLLTTVESNTNSIPTNANIAAQNPGTSQISIWNANNSGVYSGISLETRITGASRWLIGNEWKSEFLGDLFFRVRNASTTSTEALRITSAGRVGIGTTSPTSPFTVRTPNGNEAQAEFSGANVGRGLKLSTGTATLGDALVIYDAQTSTGQHAFNIAGTEALRIDNSRRLLVGTASALSNLSYEGTTTLSPQIQLIGSTASTAHLGIVRTSGGGPSDLTLGWGSSGNVAASNQDIGALLFSAFDGSVYRNAAYIQCEADGAHAAGDTPGRLTFSTTADGASSPTERMRISASGRLTCGSDNRNATLGTDDQFAITGSGYTAFHGLNATAYTIGQNSNARGLRIGSGTGWATTGVSLAAGGTSWGTYSDERLKTDIVELSDCLDSIKDVRCISYRLTDVDTAESKKRLGIIAQDLVGKYDEAINESRRSDDDETEYLSVQYTDLVPVLIKALQEASSRIENLEAAVTALQQS